MRKSKIDQCLQSGNNGNCRGLIWVLCYNNCYNTVIQRKNASFLFTHTPVTKRTNPQKLKNNNNHDKYNSYAWKHTES